MTTLPGGLGGLMRQPQYAHKGSRSARYAAHFYRPIIFILTVTIVSITLWHYWYEDLVVRYGLISALVVYGINFVGRLRMNSAQERKYYRPLVQFYRGQFSLFGVTLMIGVLAAHGLNDHNIWLLYVLATLIISEHNSTPIVLLTLVEVFVVYVGSSYLGWGVFSEQWHDLLQFWGATPHLGVNILGIWLVTFVFHYLVRNIQGRDASFTQHERWLNLVVEQWAASDQPVEQRRALLTCAQELTNARAKLWLPRLSDDQLIDMDGESADTPVHLAVAKRRPILLLRNRLPRHFISNALIYTQPLVESQHSARIVIPIHRLDDDQGLIGVLDLAYQGSQPDDFRLERDICRLSDLATHARLILISSRHSEQSQVEKALAARLSQLLEVNEIVKQVVQDVVDEFGFDLASVSLVDNNENLIRCIEGRNANWVRASVHPLACEDVQSQTVRQGRVHKNNGEWEPCLDKRIWRKYQHRHLSRVWVPIPRPSPDPGRYPALGTIEAGFRHVRRKTISPNLIALLERYARHVGLALANAQLHERKHNLVNALTALQEISQKIQSATAFYEPYQMAHLIGGSAEKLLNADIVMLYTLEEASGELKLPYFTQHAILGKNGLIISLEKGVLAKLYSSHRSYFSTDARKDPELVNLKLDGTLDSQRRTFTQRQNIKSFAGLPLLGKRGNVLGFLCVNYRRRHEFSPEERQIIELFAAQASLAIEESFNHHLARSVAISKERTNLATELHHNLSQNLFGLELNARTALAHIEHGDIELARANLHKICQIATTGREELGHMLDELRAQPRPQTDFVAELSDHVERMRLLYESPIYFNHSVGTTIVPFQVQFYLLRIAREALNNALRHARGADIRIVYSVNDTGIVDLTIEDDGPGFVVEQEPRADSHGIASMKAYAHKIDSKLTISSQTGYGTRINVRFCSEVKNGR